MRPSGRGPRIYAAEGAVLRAVVLPQIPGLPWASVGQTRAGAERWVHGLIQRPAFAARLRHVDQVRVETIALDPYIEDARLEADSNLEGRFGTIRVRDGIWSRWILIHELAHLATWDEPGHGPRFVGCLVAFVDDAFGIIPLQQGRPVPSLWALLAESPEGGQQGCPQWNRGSRHSKNIGRPFSTKSSRVSALHSSDFAEICATSCSRTRSRGSRR